MTPNLLRGGALALVLAATLPAFAHRDGGAAADPAPIVIGHRGASGHLPEHTLASYALAIELGADYVEPDLVATKDGHLIARHEPNITATTDVATRPEFAARRTTKLVDGVAETGFFASDFTLAEIKKLRAVQPAGERDQGFNGRFEVPTLEEIIELVRRKSAEKQRRIGLYPETKHPTYHQGLGLALEDRLLRVLTRAGWNHRGAPVYIQSFETANLRYLRTRTELPLVQLVDADGIAPDGRLTYAAPFDKPYDWVVSGRAGGFADLLTPAGLAEVATYADGIGPWKPYIRSSACTLVNGACSDVNGDGLVNDADRTLLPPTDLVQRAHALGLVVHPYTFRSEQRRLAKDYAGNPVNEYLDFYTLGVDGMFSDFPDAAVAARALFLLKTDAGYARCLIESRCGRGRR
ncbi:glycerophosphodiester phosphodiesterase [Piscinibacter defluvii]|uniref:glycerophosphodiester phosphodiesterase n=1 Tax=Piscinibacter defluvii TaxID=1796922 RepID=UPI000FDD1746|nr:glycerophosphodiester phosphodiesterase [Piscinibacter defluvii]